MQPKARAEALIVQEMTGETLVYDRRTDKAHCLNAAAAAVWRVCDGKTGVDEMAQIIGSETGVPADADVVRVALEQLRKAALLEEESLAVFDSRISRRAVAKRLGLALAVLPAVITVLAPQAASAASAICCLSSPECPVGMTCSKPQPGCPPAKFKSCV